LLSVPFGLVYSDHTTCLDLASTRKMVPFAREKLETGCSSELFVLPPKAAASELAPPAGASPLLLPLASAGSFALASASSGGLGLGAMISRVAARLPPSWSVITVSAFLGSVTTTNRWSLVRR